MRKGIGLFVLAVVIFSVIASGCISGGTTSTTQTPSQTSKKVSMTEKETTNVVIYGYGHEMVTLDPSTEFSNSVIILANVYECLVKYTPNGLKPWLATSWESNKNGTVWIFHLRHGVKFHTGDTMTAEDVKWSIERTIRMGLGPSYIWDPVKKIEVVNNYTIKFYLKYPANLPLIASSAYGAYIMDSKYLSRIGDDKAIANWFNQGHDAGTGPYTIVKYNPRTEIVLKKFKDYWGGWSNDQFDLAIIKIIPDATLREEMVVNNKIQITRDLPLDDLPKLKDNPNVIVDPAPSYQELYAFFNTKKEPLNNKLVRQALSYAVPYNEIVKYILHGYGEVAKGPIPKGMLGYFKNMETYTYNISKAKHLLAQAGYPNGGFKLVLTYTQGDQAEAKVAEIIKAEWKKLGVNVEIRPMNWNQQWALAKSNPLKAQDILMMYWWPTYPTPYDFLFNMFHCEKKTLFNLCYYCNPEFDRLIDEAVGLEGVNLTKATSLYRKAEQILIADAPAIFLYDPDAVYVYNKSIKGFEYNPGYPQVVFFYELHKV